MLDTPYLTRRVFLTLLSPVHVGCGETYEPTNYVIDRGVLYGFDSIPVKLNAQELSELQRLGSKGDWVELASFFHRNRQRFMPYARTSAPIGATVRGKQIKQIEKKDTETAPDRTHGVRARRRRRPILCSGFKRQGRRAYGIARTPSERGGSWCSDR